MIPGRTWTRANVVLMPRHDDYGHPRVVYSNNPYARSDEAYVAVPFSLLVDELPELPRFLSAGGIIVSPRRLAQGCASAPPRAILSAAFDCSRTLSDHRIPAETRSILRSNVRIYMDDMLSTIPYLAPETDNGKSHAQMLMIEDILFSDSPQLTGAPLFTPPIHMIPEHDTIFLGQEVVAVAQRVLCARLVLPGDDRMVRECQRPSFRLQSFASHMSPVARMGYINIFIVAAERKCSFALHQFNASLLAATDFALAGWPLKMFVEALRRRIFKLDPETHRGQILGHRLAATTIAASIHISHRRQPTPIPADVMMEAMRLHSSRCVPNSSDDPPSQPTHNKRALLT
eukprot:SAG11_NODE_970_length_6354_cov_11.865867_1_plen_345_part_00